MLPCSFVDEIGQGGEIAANHPVASMAAVDNRDLEPFEGNIRNKLMQVSETVWLACSVLLQQGEGKRE